MFFNKYKVEILNYKIDISKMPNTQSARLIYVNGKGTLSQKGYTTNDFENYFYNQICLNDIPLIQINSPACPTCKSVLSTGYGIQNADCKELKNIQEKINLPFNSLEKSIEDITPLLTLLSTGLYIVADNVYYPTDGNGNFFWNTPNNPTINPATSDYFYHNGNSNSIFIDGHPIFLYPTQSASCYNEERVQDYMNIFKSEGSMPRPIVYNFSAFLSFVIDGHHKICSAFRLKKEINCLTIIPLTSYSYKENNKAIGKLFFSAFDIPLEDIPKKYTSNISIKPIHTHKFKLTAGNINNRIWEKEYFENTSYYPTLEQYALLISNDIDLTDITKDEIIKKALEDTSSENFINNEKILISALVLMQFKRDKRLKQTAISCIKRGIALEKAYSALSTIKNDTEVEDILIDFLINNIDKTTKLFKIVNSYWD